MNPNQPAAVPAAALLKAFVPLGTYHEQSWSPLGAATLVLDDPLLWLVTTRSLIQRARGTPIAAFLDRSGSSEVLDLTTSHASNGVDWVEDPAHDLAISLFPADAELGIRAFTQPECAPIEELLPFLPASSVGCPYGVELGFDRPTPMMFDGVLSRLDPVRQRVFSTAPLLGRNEGAPLALAFGLGGPLRLVGILTGSVVLPEPGLPPVRLSVATSVAPIWELVRSDAARAQRELALAGASRGAPPA